LPIQSPVYLTYLPPGLLQSPTLFFLSTFFGSSFKPMPPNCSFFLSSCSGSSSRYRSALLFQTSFIFVPLRPRSFNYLSFLENWNPASRVYPFLISSSFFSGHFHFAWFRLRFKALPFCLLSRISLFPNGRNHLFSL